MIAEQLKEIRKNKKTHLNNSSSELTFFPNLSIGKSELLDMIQIPSPYATIRSLNFERQQLSEKEEARFNSKFSPYLKSLINSMNHPQIDILLEYFLRMYCIDTYNQKELFFLLFPFPRYFKQICILAKNCNSKFSLLKSYSHLGIAKTLVKENSLLYMFIEYFKNYSILSDFLNKILEELIEIAKSSSGNFVSEFYEIFKHLCDSGHSKKALEIYHRMRSYLDSDEFIVLLSKHFLHDEIIMKNEKAKPISIYELHYINKSGRSLLKDLESLKKYLIFLEDNCKVPSEFSTEELSVLKNVFPPKPNHISVFDSSKLKNLYSEISPKLPLTKYLFDKINMLDFIQFMNNEDLAFVSSKLLSFEISILNDKNHCIVLKNLSKFLFDENYSLILHNCLSFPSFDCSIFSKFIFFEFETAIAKKNLIKLAESTNTPFYSYISQDNYYDDVYLEYLLSLDINFDKNYIDNLISIVKAKSNPAIVSSASHFLFRSSEESASIDFLLWAFSKGFLHNCFILIEKYFKRMPSDLLIDYILVKDSEMVLKEVVDRDSNFINNLYSLKRYDLIFSAFLIFGIDKILMKNESTCQFIDKFHKKLNSSIQIINFLLQNICELEYFKLLSIFFEDLIKFRKHEEWESIKILIISELKFYNLHQNFMDYIILNIDYFENDKDLFEILLDESPVISKAQIASICNKTKPAAELLDLIVSKETVQIFPVIPLVSPILIKYNMSSVEELFKNRPKIMGAYCKNIIMDYPSIIRTLIYCEPHHSLISILNYSADNPQIDLVNQLNALAIKILDKSKTQNQSLINNICKRLLCESLTSFVSYELLKAFVSFYIRSFNSVSNLEVTKIMFYIFSAYKPNFYEIVDEFIFSNSLIFKNVIKFMLNNIKQYDPLNIYTLSKYCASLELDANDAFEICKAIYYYKDEYSAASIANICKYTPEIINKIHSFIENSINKRENVVFAIDLLKFLFSEVKEYSEYKSSVFSMICILTENQNEQISSKAIELYEMLQFK